MKQLRLKGISKMGNAKILGCVGRLATVLVIIGLLCGCGSDVGSNYDNRELEDCEWRRIQLWRPYDLVDRGGRRLKIGMTEEPKTDTWIDRFVLVAAPLVIVLFYVAGVVNMIRRPRKKMVCNRDGTGAIPDQGAGENAVCRQRQICFLKALGMCFTRWTFKGRSSRSEFWWPTLVFAGVIYIPRIGLILALLMVIPLFLVEVRRLHDTGRSGWILWAFLVPWAAPLLFGYLGMLFFCPAMALLAIVVFCIEASPSQPEENQYGPVPNIEEAPL